MAALEDPELEYRLAKVGSKLMKSELFLKLNREMSALKGGGNPQAMAVLRQIVDGLRAPLDSPESHWDLLKSNMKLIHG